jgi:hypothetical protein
MSCWHSNAVMGARSRSTPASAVVISVDISCHLRLQVHCDVGPTSIRPSLAASEFRKIWYTCREPAPSPPSQLEPSSPYTISTFTPATEIIAHRAGPWRHLLCVFNPVSYECELVLPRLMTDTHNFCVLWKAPITRPLLHSLQVELMIKEGDSHAFEVRS